MNKPIDPRERYLDIAARRFAEAGFAGVSLAALASDAGVTKQALLHHFGTKERIYAEVLTRLSERLCEEIDASAAGSAEQRLLLYFNAYAKRALARPEDSRLTLRALLDSRPDARIWPMKPFLDKLIELALETPRWRGAAPEEALAGLYQLLGAIQYVAISSPTLAGMYGDGSADALAPRFVEDFGKAARAYVGRAP